MNKKILISLGVIGVVAAIAIGGTIAYFSDTETSSGNTFSAGTLNLKVGNDDPTSWRFNIGNIEPGDSGSQEVAISNTGSIDGYLNITSANLINDDVSCPEPEGEVDGTCGAGQVGELAENLDILVYLDNNGNDVFNLGTDTLIYRGKVKGILQGDLFNYSLSVSASRDFRIEWSLDSLVGNIIQSDKTDFDVVFELTQNKKEIVGDWHFNEGTGGIAYDSALEPADNGTINGAIWASGKYNPALSFDGVNDYVGQNVGSFSVITDNFTMELWASPSSTRASTVKANSGISGISAQRYAIYPTWGDLYGAGHAGAGISVGTNGISVFEHAPDYLPSLLVYDTTLTGWNHIVVVYANKQPKLYLNGNLVETGLTSTKIVHPSKENFGGMSYGWYNGAIDEVRIYNKALSDTAIFANYQKGL